MIRSKNDAQIQQAVLKELRWDSHIDETEVGVEVHKGVVTLTGTVSSYTRKLAAQEAAHRVPGVLDVANDLQVKIPGGLTRTDTEIAQAVRRELEWDTRVPHERIHTTVADGWVTLEGEVDLLRQREDAERTVRYLLGVRGVRNNITVKSPALKPGEVQKLIEEVLERRAEREADRIKVSVSNGTVTLAGQVRSWMEKRALMGAISHAPGVQVIKDQLRISPFA